MKTGCKEVSRDVYEVEFADIFDRVIACAAGMPINAVNGRFRGTTGIGQLGCVPRFHT